MKAAFLLRFYIDGSQRQRNLLRTVTRSRISCNFSCVIVGAKIGSLGVLIWSYRRDVPGYEINFLAEVGIYGPGCPDSYRDVSIWLSLQLVPLIAGLPLVRSYCY